MGKRKREDEEKKKHKRPKKEKRKRKEGNIENEQPLSHLYRKHVIATASLLPADLKEKQQGVESTISMHLLKYVPALQGVLLSFQDVKILDHGFILNDQCYSHYKISYDALVFGPKIGETLQGKITKVFSSHVVVLVLQYFTASISAEALDDAGFEYSNQDEVWQLPGETSVPVDLTVGTNVSFQVERIYELAGILSMSGKLPYVIES